MTRTEKSTARTVDSKLSVAHARRRLWRGCRCDEIVHHRGDRRLLRRRAAAASPASSFPGVLFNSVFEAEHQHRVSGQAPRGW